MNTTISILIKTKVNQGQTIEQTIQGALLYFLILSLFTNLKKIDAVKILFIHVVMFISKLWLVLLINDIYMSMVLLVYLFTLYIYNCG